MKLFVTNLLLLFKLTLSNNALFLVDVQKCFLNEFPVFGTTLNFNDLAHKIESNINNIDYIAVIKNSYNYTDINNKLNWINSTGHHPSNYEKINTEDIGKNWWPTSVSLEYSINYSKELKKNNKNPIIIWPDHCVVDTEGHNIIDNIQNSITEWENKKNKTAVIIEKGFNDYSELYGILPEVRLPLSLSKLNIENIQKVVDVLLNYKNITIVGDIYSPSVLPFFYNIHEILFDWLKIPNDELPKINFNLDTDIMEELEENVKNAFDWVKNKIKKGVNDIIETIFIDEL